MSKRTTKGNAAMVVPECPFIESIVRSEEQCCVELRRVRNPRAAIVATLQEYDGLFKMIQPFLFLREYQNPHILEIGSGNGLALCELLRLGLKSVGIEPGTEPGLEGRYENAQTLLGANGFAPTARFVFAGRGEKLLFAEASFDIVASVAVLEHVQDVLKTITAAGAVLKPGGLLLMNVPNYDSFKEWHSDIPWLPYIPHDKRRAAAYARLFGRSVDFLEHLNFTTSRMLGRMLARYLRRRHTDLRQSARRLGFSFTAVCRKREVPGCVG